MWSGLLDGSVADHPLRSDEFGTHFVTYQGARTRYFDAHFRAAAEAGVRKFVLLAAGLDSRAYRLDWATGTTVFELDQPRVLEFKRQTLEQCDRSPRPSVARSTSICATTGLLRCAPAAFGTTSRQHGLPRAY